MRRGFSSVLVSVLASTLIPNWDPAIRDSREAQKRAEKPKARRRSFYKGVRKPPINGARECARRRKQMANGQLIDTYKLKKEVTG